MMQVMLKMTMKMTTKMNQMIDQHATIVVEHPTYDVLEQKILDRNDILLRQYSHYDPPYELAEGLAEGFHRLAIAVANKDSDYYKIMILQDMYSLMCMYSDDITLN